MYSKKKLKLLFKGFFIVTLAIFITNCNGDDDNDNTTNEVVVDVDSSLFLTDGGKVIVNTVPCTLSDGTVADCLEIVTNSSPTDHMMGPWCPDNISDGADKGGIWLENGQVYDVDGAFIQNMATLYEDTNWKMYDANGDIYTTETQEDCANAANPNVGEEYENLCVECLPAYVEDLTKTHLIPITPVKQSNSIDFGGVGPMGGDGPTVRGVAFNGVQFDAPAPTDAILRTYTLAPFDDAGGHINLVVGYHYHAATGVSTQITQNDDHGSMIGYALDGHGLYAELDSSGNEEVDLDDCRGHTDNVRGYHYHVAAPGNNNFINCLQGAYANN